MNSVTTFAAMQSMEQSTAPTVLVVEDEVMVRMLISEYLRDCGYNVLEAGDAAEAIDTVEATGGVNLVFSDVRMPGSMDGFDLARWLQDHYPDVPVLLTSGYNTNRNGLADAPRVIAKPYSQAQVANRIAAILDH
jgi:two-component system, response regulator PdtaR